MGMANMFVMGLSQIAELLIAVKRIEGFLQSEEFVPSSNLKLNLNVKENGYTENKSIVNLHNISSKWTREISEVILKDINLNIERGQMIGVIGPVGCGKSALLQTILGKFYFAFCNF